ncbi:MAG: glycosyltransferase family 61 protein [Roseomonas sp.]|nr:glycosyltransferase family 61 protein [Roseomonas sp.]
MPPARPDEPALTELHDVTLAPVRSPQGPWGKHFLGVFDRHGQFLDGFAHPWCGVDAMPAAPIAPYAGTAIYGGLAMHHVGHFLLEGLSRLWCLQRYPEHPILWHWIDLPIPHPDDRGWQKELIGLLGLAKHRHIFLRQPLRVERLLLPSPGFLSGQFIHAVQAAALGCVSGPETVSGKRVWLSRSALPHQLGRVAGEDQVEALLSAQGWTILHPERESMRRSAEIFHEAEVVSGFIGTAFHPLLLHAAPRARLRPVIRPGISPDDYRIAAEAKGLDFAAIETPMTALDQRASWTNFQLDAPADLVRILAES